jgi:lactoylglutathione lyase
MTMTLEHVAIWTHNLELLKDFYVMYFNGVANSKYTNESNNFRVTFSLSNPEQDLNLCQCPIFLTTQTIGL